MTAAAPDADAAAALAARLLDIDLPPECRAGVAENLALLAAHVRRVLDQPA